MKQKQTIDQYERGSKLHELQLKLALEAMVDYIVNNGNEDSCTAGAKSPCRSQLEPFKIHLYFKNS